MANFEVLCWNIWSSINLLFLKSDEPLIFNKFQKIRIYIGTYLYLLLYLPAPCSFLIFMAISKFDLNMHRVTEFSMHACTWNTCCMKSYHRVSDLKQNYVKSPNVKLQQNSRENNLVYAMLDQLPNEAFNIEPNSGKIKLTKQLDYETDKNFILTVRVTESR